MFITRYIVLRYFVLLLAHTRKVNSCWEFGGLDCSTRQSCNGLDAPGFATFSCTGVCSFARVWWPWTLWVDGKWQHQSLSCTIQTSQPLLSARKFHREGDRQETSERRRKIRKKSLFFLREQSLIAVELLVDTFPQSCATLWYVPFMPEYLRRQCEQKRAFLAALVTLFIQSESFFFFFCFHCSQVTRWNRG